MSFIETNFNKPTRHNPYLHEIIVDQLKGLPPGKTLDIPSGPGYLLQDLFKLNFTGYAAEIDEKLHCLTDVEYKKINMIEKFPFQDSEFDYVVSVEGIEHIENHFSFLREIRRVLKKDGKFILTTPNVHSLESRWQFFWSGFHNLATKPISINTPNIYFEHINPIPFHQLYFICETAGLRIEKLKTHRLRTGSKLFYYLFYPFVKFSIFRHCFLKKQTASEKQENKRLYKFLTSKENLLGTHTIIVATAK